MKNTSLEESTEEIEVASENANPKEYDSDCIVVEEVDKIQQRSSSPKPLKYVPNPFSTTYKEIYLSKKSFFTKSERKELKEYNANTYNPNKGKEAQQQNPWFFNNHNHHNHSN